MNDQKQMTDSKESTDTKKPGGDLVRTGLLLLGSAVFGGIAVVIWNRRTLAKMQAAPESLEIPPKIVEDDAIY